MYTLRKLKPVRSYGWILLPFGAMALFLAAGAVFGISAAYVVGGAFYTLYAAYSLLTYLRTGKPGFIVVTLFQLSVGLVAFTWVAGLGQRPNRLALFFIAWMVFFAAWSVLLAVTKRIKWRGREVLELAAAEVEQAQNGYTGRPLPVGKTDFTKEHILGFAEFARRHLIAATYIGRDRVAFVPVREGMEPPFILGLKNDYVGETWVCFDFAGNVSANVSQRDYLDFREALSFDKLCQSLGDLFVEFVGLFQRGEGVRVIDRLDAVGLSMFE
jgi:hypothetical protein